MTGKQAAMEKVLFIRSVIWLAKVEWFVIKQIKYVPVFQNGKQLQRQYYAFWRADTVKDYVEDFAALLEQSFLREK